MISINDISFAYRKNSNILEHISLELSEGRIYGLLGLTGIGKSTLLKMICGLLQPNSGSIEIDGEIPVKRHPGLLSEIFYIPEDFRGPDMKIIRYADMLGKFYPKYDRNMFLDLMQELEVDPERSFSKMSLGQHKKSILSVALSMNTKYLIMDEPTNGLDIPTKSEFKRIMSRLLEENRTVIISTHQVKDVENLLDDIIILDKKSVLLNSPVSEIQKEYFFSVADKAPEDALYSERMLGGETFIRKAREGEESGVNIELLFNYIIKSSKNR